RDLTSPKPPITNKNKMAILSVRNHRALALLRVRATIGTIRTIAGRKGTHRGNALMRSGNRANKESIATIATTTGQRASICVTSTGSFIANLYDYDEVSFLGYSIVPTSRRGRGAGEVVKRRPRIAAQESQARSFRGVLRR